MHGNQMFLFLSFFLRLNNDNNLTKNKNNLEEKRIVLQNNREKNLTIII